MTSLFQNILIAHVLLGLLAIAFSVALLVFLLKKDINIRSLKLTSLVSFLSFLASWVAGGYYYLYYYGSSVKPIIKGGDYAWIHSIVMETKEHVFLFLPFLSFVVLLVIWLFADRLKDDTELKKSLTLVEACIVFLGVAIAFMGVAISGAVR